MADETVVTATVDAGASSAAAPDTTSSAAAPVASATTSSTPAVDAPLTRGVDEDGGAFLRRVTEANNKKAQAQTTEPAKTEPAKEEPKAEPAKVEEPKPEEKKEEPVEDDVDAEPFSLEDKAPLPPRELAAKLKADPELAAKLEAAGIKDEVFANARLANKAVAFIEEFPGGVEDAKYAKGQAETFGQLDDALTSIKSEGLPAVDRLIGMMMNLDYVVDPATGQPIKGADGQPVSQGHVQEFVSTLGRLSIEKEYSDAIAEAKEVLKANPDDETANSILAAVDILKSRKNGSDPEGEMTPAQKAKQAELDSRDAASARDRETARVAEHEAREARIGTAIDAALDSDIVAILGKTDLPKEQYPLILNEVKMAAVEKLTADTLFTSKRDWIMRAFQRDPKAVEAQRVAHAVAKGKSVLTGPKGVLAPTLKKYGVKQVAANQERRAKIDAQIKNSEKDVKGSVGLAAAPSPLSGPELAAKARAEIKKAGGDEWDTHELNRMMTKLRSQGA